MDGARQTVREIVLACRVALWLVVGITEPMLSVLRYCCTRGRSQLSQIQVEQASRLPKRGRFAGGCRRDACATFLVFAMTRLN